MKANGNDDTVRRVWDALEAQPKPAEPIGLGAVVEDAEGRKWVRDVAGPNFSQAWYLRGSELRDYDEINAVRVLSEGVMA